MKETSTRNCMKKKNSISEFSSQRNRELVENFRRAIAAQSEIALADAFRKAVETPAPRFWVSEARAAAVIGKMVAGEDPLAGMYPEKRDMYLEIYARFLELRAQRPEETITALVFEVVNGEAPRAYMSWQRARIIIYNERRRIRMERRRR